MNVSDAANSRKIADLCTTELTSLLWYANLFLGVAAVAATIVTAIAIVAQIIAFFKKPAKAAANDEAGGGIASALIDSLKGLVTALAQAPAWFAIFLAAILLLWIAPTYFGSRCALVTGVATAPNQNATDDGDVAAADNSPA